LTIVESSFLISFRPVWTWFVWLLPFSSLEVQESKILFLRQIAKFVLLMTKFQVCILRRYTV